MSAGTLGLAKAANPLSRSLMRAGYTRISPGTLQRLVAAIAAESFDVPLREVRAGICDEPGHLDIQLALPLALADGSTAFERAASARAIVAERMNALAGSTIRRVDVRFTGIHDVSMLGLGRTP